MVKCAEIAGMVQGPMCRDPSASSYPTVTELEQEARKQQMVKCAEIDGMVQGPMCRDPSAGPYPTVTELEQEARKQQMVKCAEIAEMVQGPICRDPSASPYPTVTELEQEAASVYCQAKWKDSNSGKGSKFLVVDEGEGTVDLMVHEKMESSGLKIKEVSVIVQCLFSVFIVYAV
ncbi:hypothetical protein R1sor_013880 [Riccia sorocarpa]|uniref:Uncharacterized protein n=1 Tax=Riccia sorocarpa TaxID=122646 RepID=A0ABD3H9R2_9MARC